MTLITPRVSLSLSLAHGQLVVSAPSPYTVRRTVADGRWHHVRIDNKIMKIDNGSYGLPRPLSALATSAATLLIGTSQSFNSIEGKFDFTFLKKLNFWVAWKTWRSEISRNCPSTVKKISKSLVIWRIWWWLVGRRLGKWIFLQEEKHFCRLPQPAIRLFSAEKLLPAYMTLIVSTCGTKSNAHAARASRGRSVRRTSMNVTRQNVFMDTAWMELGRLGTNFTYHPK